MINQKLLNDVARHLSGRPAVAVRLQPPAWDGAGACCWKTHGEGAIIDVDPGTLDFLHAFLHEVAHLRYDFSVMTPTDVWKSIPGSLKMTSNPGTNERENKAEKQAQIWEKYAAENTWKYYSANSSLEKKLLALLDAVDPYEKPDEIETWKKHQLAVADEFHYVEFKKYKGLKNYGKSKK